MSRKTVRAVYERGILRPLEQLDLPEQIHVKITIVEGMRRVTAFVADIVESLADAGSRPTYRATRRPRMASGGDRPYFGSIPDFSQQSGGYALQGVAPNSPAERAGIKAEDVIIKFGESKIGSLEDFDSALRKYKGGDQVPVTVLRAGESLTLDVTLDPPR